MSQLAITSSRSLLVRIGVDRSQSIETSGNASAVRQVHNNAIRHLRERAGERDVLCRTQFLSGAQLFGFCRPEAAPLMDEKNYRPMETSSGIKDSVLTLIGGARAEAAKYRNRHQGRDVGTITLIITDGADIGSSATDERVRNAVRSLIASGKHAVCGIGVHDGNITVSGVLAGMGIPDELIRIVKETPGKRTRGLWDLRDLVS